MRILRGLSSQFLPCGCLAGVYETYHGTVVTIVDARGQTCTNALHQLGKIVPAEQATDEHAGLRIRSTSSGRR